MSEQEQIRDCMENSYRILTGKNTLSDILSKNSSPHFLWNVLERDCVQESIYIEIIDMLIEYFEYNEEYERCEELLKLKKNDKNRHRKKIGRIGSIRKRSV